MAILRVIVLRCNIPVENRLQGQGWPLVRNFMDGRHFFSGVASFGEAQT